MSPGRGTTEPAWSTRRQTTPPPPRAAPVPPSPEGKWTSASGPFRSGRPSGASFSHPHRGIRALEAGSQISRGLQGCAPTEGSGGGAGLSSGLRLPLQSCPPSVSLSKSPSSQKALPPSV